MKVLIVYGCYVINRMCLYGVGSASSIEIPKLCTNVRFMLAACRHWYITWEISIDEAFPTPYKHILLIT